MYHKRPIGKKTVPFYSSRYAYYFYLLIFPILPIFTKLDYPPSQLTCPLCTIGVAVWQMGVSWEGKTQVGNLGGGENGENGKVPWAESNRGGWGWV